MSSLHFTKDIGFSTSVIWQSFTKLFRNNGVQQKLCSELSVDIPAMETTARPWHLREIAWRPGLQIRTLDDERRLRLANSVVIVFESDLRSVL